MPKLIGEILIVWNAHAVDPCAIEGLQNILRGDYKLLKQPPLRAIVGRIHKLPSLPSIDVALQSIVADESVTLGDVAKLVAADSALAARVLQMVNSAFFRLPRKILAKLPDNQSWISEVILAPRLNSTLVKSRAICDQALSRDSPS